VAVLYEIRVLALKIECSVLGMAHEKQLSCAFCALKKMKTQIAIISEWDREQDKALLGRHICPLPDHQFRKCATVHLQW
jgi:hypothetical protein